MASDASEGVKWRVRARQHCRVRTRSAGVRRRTGTFFRAPVAPSGLPRAVRSRRAPGPGGACWRHLVMSLRAVVRRVPEAPGRGRRVAWSRRPCGAPARALPIQATPPGPTCGSSSTPWWTAHVMAAWLAAHAHRPPDEAIRNISTESHVVGRISTPPASERTLTSRSGLDTNSNATGAVSNYRQRQSPAPTDERAAEARDGPSPDRTSSTHGQLSNPPRDCESVRHPPCLPATPNVSDLAPQPPPSARHQSNLRAVPDSAQTSRRRQAWNSNPAVSR